MALAHNRPRRRRFLPALLACLALAVADGGAQCLYGKTPGTPGADPQAAACTNREDPAGLGNDPDIRKVISALGLQDVRIRFSGCAHGLFATEATGLASAPSYRISYPLLPAQGPAGSRGNAAGSPAGPPVRTAGRHPYLAPVTHELAHVLQLRQKGDRNALLTGRQILSVELAADFIAGIAFRRIEALDSLNSFQQNIALVGLYRDRSDDAHGTWEQRTWAFRRGVFYPTDPAPLAPQEADDRFASRLFRDAKNVGSSVAQIMATGSLPDEFPGNKMSACAEVDGLYDALRRGRTMLGACRAPHSALERAFADNNQRISGESTCFLENPPAPMFAGYSCWQLKSMPGSLECFRPVNRRMVTDHLADKTIDASLAYRNAAAACGADVSVAVPTLMSFPVAHLFKFEFGFNRGLGSGNPAPGAMRHGVATALKPEKTGGVETIEFVTMFAKGLVTTPDQARPSEAIGDWRVEVDWMDESTQQMEKIFRKQAVPMAARMVDIGIRRREGAPAPARTREAQVQRWQRTIAAHFEREGFDPIPESKLRTSNGKSIFKTFEEMRLSGDYQLPGMSPNMYFYASQTAPGCTDSEHGITAAMVFATELRPEADDYGAVGVIFMAAGDCGRNSPATRKYMKEILDHSINAVRTSLKEQP